MDKVVMYYGSPNIIKEPFIKATRFYKDFGWGFYCTKVEKQAIRLAIDKEEINDSTNVIDKTIEVLSPD